MTLVAENAGDYVYPSDVRVDIQDGLLYIKAHGLAGGLSEETWLFEYDLLRQHSIGRVQVRNNILHQECSGQ